MRCAATATRSGGATHGFTKFYREPIRRNGPVATYTDDQMNAVFGSPDVRSAALEKE